MAKKKGETSVKIYQDWCKGCGICVTFCPSGVLKLNKQGKAEVAHEEECINCGFCEIHCPDFAILVQPKNETRSGKSLEQARTPAPEAENAPAGK
jgi:2-oxoglutarate ferredoxin oxidoreductase subunit delta